jgi:peptide/nickel transport system permease protein
MASWGFQHRLEWFDYLRNEMKSYLARRFLQLIPTIFGISLLTFFLIRRMPGDPCQINHSQFVPIEVIERCRTEYGLHLPIFQQYFFYLGSLFSGNPLMVQSTVYGQSAIIVSLEHFPITLFLAGYASVLTLVLAFPVGLVSALKPDSLFDRCVRSLTATALTLPAFLTGMLLILIFSLKLHFFPTSGYGKDFLDHLRHLFLPALTLAIANGAMLARVLRRSLLNVATFPHVLTAHAKGLSDRWVFIHHVFRNGLISPVTLLSLQIAWLLSGALVVENVFSLPGMGSLMVQSIFDRDYAVVQMATIFFAVMVTGMTFLSDLIYPLLDPRVLYD